MGRTIRPLKDNIIVKQDKPKEKLASGLFVPQNSRDLYEDTGEVIAVGTGRVLPNGTVLPLSVKPGDRIYFKRRPASALEGEWEGLLVLRDEDVIGLCEEA
jgi:chaperonin GroES